MFINFAAMGRLWTTTLKTLNFKLWTLKSPGTRFCVIYIYIVYLYVYNLVLVWLLGRCFMVLIYCDLIKHVMPLLWGNKNTSVQRSHCGPYVRVLAKQKNAFAGHLWSRHLYSALSVPDSGDHAHMVFCCSFHYDAGLPIHSAPGMVISAAHWAGTLSGC